MATASGRPRLADLSDWMGGRPAARRPLMLPRLSQSCRSLPCPFLSLLLFLLLLLDKGYCVCRVASPSPQRLSQQAFFFLRPTGAVAQLHQAARQEAAALRARGFASDRLFSNDEAPPSYETQAAAVAAASHREGAAAAALPPPADPAVAAAAAAAESEGELRPRLTVGQRRALDKRLNWHKQYIYGPVDPTAALRRKTPAAADAAKEAAKPPELLLQLSPQRRPAGRRWRLLEELEAGEEVLLAAGAAAKETVERVSFEQQAGGALKGPRRKVRQSRGAEAALPLQLQMRRAALRAAAEAIEKEFLNIKRQQEEEKAPRIGAPLWDAAAPSTLFKKDTENLKVSLQAWGPRAIFARELGRLIHHRAALAAAGGLQAGRDGGGDFGAPAGHPTGGPDDPQVSTTSVAVPAASDTDAGAPPYHEGNLEEKSSRQLSLLAALLPREGATQRPSSALLTCQLLCTAGFDETIEVHVHLKPRTKRGAARTNQRVQGFVALPHGVIPTHLFTQEQTKGAAAAEAREIRGKTRGGIWRRLRVIAALVPPGEETAAKAAGADLVGLNALLKSIEGGKRGPDILISTPELMASLSAHGKILGRRNLIPSVAMGTLTEDPLAAIRLYRQTTIQFRADRLGVVHAPIGYASMETPHLLANFHTFLDALKAASSASKQGTGTGSLAKVASCVHICSTMGPSVEIDMRSC